MIDTVGILVPILQPTGCEDLTKPTPNGPTSLYFGWVETESKNIVGSK